MKKNKTPFGKLNLFKNDQLHNNKKLRIGFIINYIIIKNSELALLEEDLTHLLVSLIDCQLDLIIDMKP